MQCLALLSIGVFKATEGVGLPKVDTSYLSIKQEQESR